MEDLPGFDIVVIGGGVIGCAVAAALQNDARSVLVLEKESRLGTGVTGRNSGVIHAGLYYAPGSLKATTCLEGNPRLYEFCARHEVWHQKCGKWVVALSPAQLPALEAFFAHAVSLGARGLVMHSRESARAIAPTLHCAAAVFSAETGVVDPHELVQALRFQAESHGAMFVTDAEVTAIMRTGTGFVLRTARGEINCERVINAAGLFADRVAALVGVDRFTIHPCRGDYFRLRVPFEVPPLIYPVRDPANPGLGIHLTSGRDGLRLGPDAQYVEARDDFSPAESKHEQFRSAASALLGVQIAPERLQYDSCGIRPKLRGPRESEEKDFVLLEEPAGCIHMIGIESPGLTASLALAERVKSLV